MTEKKPDMKTREAMSVADCPAALFISEDPSLASTLISHGIRVRDFLLLSLLADQGPMSIAQLSRSLRIEPERVANSLKLLADAGFLTRQPVDVSAPYSCIAQLTTKGQGIAGRMDEQL